MNQSQKSKLAIWFDIAIASINFIVINYALSNMALLFNYSLLYVLFFASECWVLSSYWKYVKENTQSKVIATIFVILCELLHIAAMENKYIENLTEPSRC